MRQYSKAIAGAIISGLAALMAKAADVDFSALGPNDIRDLVITFTGAALAGFGGVWIAPANKRQREIPSN